MRDNKPNEEALLLDHNYDGIQELDNPLPRWWLLTFYITIVFGVAYAIYYMTGIGPDLRQELDVAMQKIEAKRAAAPQPAATAGEDTALRAALNDPRKIATGKDVFQGKCVACHGANAEGGIGPNLTDKNWLHGKGRLQDIAQTIRDGVTEKGMPPWGPVLKDDEIVSVVAYIHSVLGSNPPGAKEPQGDHFDTTEL